MESRLRQTHDCFNWKINEWDRKGWYILFYICLIKRKFVISDPIKKMKNQLYLI